MWQLNAKLTRAITRRALNHWRATAQGISRVGRFVARYWVSGNLRAAWIKWRGFVVAHSYVQDTLWRLETSANRATRANVRSCFVRWREAAFELQVEQALSLIHI